MVNCNPETVSTDYDTSDRLYFEPLGVEEVLGDLRARAAGRRRDPVRRPDAAQARAGDRGRGLPDPRHAASRRSTSPRTASASRRCCDELGIAVPAVGIADERGRGGRGRGAGRLSRCSCGRRYVLGGRSDAGLLRRRGGARGRTRTGGRLLVDRFLENAIEIDVDALCDGSETFVAAVMQHVEEAGVHSGDSELRAAGAVADARERARRSRTPCAGSGRRSASVGLAQRPARARRRRALRARGEPARLAHGAVREQGDRASTSSQAACRLAAGATLADLELDRTRRVRTRSRVKAAVLPVRPLPGRRPGARAGDALDRRGDGERLRPADRVRQGRARGRAAAARERARRSSRCATRTRRVVVPGRRRRSPGSASSSLATAGTARTLAARRARGRVRAQGDRGRRGPDRRRPRPPRALRPRRSTRRRARARAPTATGSARRRSSRESRASRRSRARPRPSRRSPTRATRSR